MRLTRGVSIGVAAVLLWSGAAEAQQVRRTGRGTPRLDARLDRILEDRNYRVLSRDTLIAREDVLAGPILTLGNRLVIEGTVRGDLAIVDANVYLRPTARIEGQVINIGGGLYRSEQASISGQLIDHPLAPYHVEKTGDDVITVVGDVDHRYVRPDLKPPRANRVEGFRPYLGVTLASPPFGRYSVELFGWGAYGFEREEFEDALQGGVEFRVRRGLTQVGIGVEETSATNDAWSRGDLDNTLAFLWHGKDYRNYYQAQRQYAMVARELIRGPHQAVFSLRGQREDAASLFLGDPWVLIEPDSFRINPLISEGIISSAVLNLRGEYLGLTTAAEYDGSLEVARSDVFDGDYNFNAFRVWGEWAMKALANHTLEIEGYFQGPIGTDSLPRQRWAILGGSGTLYTYQVGEFFGDRVVYLENKYSIPLGRLRIPVLGRPRLQFLHHVGMAWSQRESSDFRQNVGLRLQFPLVYARVVTNPADTDATRFSVGVTFPRRTYPWERQTQEREPR